MESNNYKVEGADKCKVEDIVHIVLEVGSELVDAGIVGRAEYMSAREFEGVKQGCLYSFFAELYIRDRAIAAWPCFTLLDSCNY